MRHFFYKKVFKVFLQAASSHSHIGINVEIDSYFLQCLEGILNLYNVQKFFRVTKLLSVSYSSLIHCFLLVCIEQICRVSLDQIEHCHVNTRLAHATCGHFVKTNASGPLECEFCRCSCEMKTRRTFHLKITVADESGKVFAWCTGQTAIELLQISPDEFYELPEVFFCIFSLFPLKMGTRKKWMIKQYKMVKFVTSSLSDFCFLWHFKIRRNK